MHSKCHFSCSPITVHRKKEYLAQLCSSVLESGKGDGSSRVFPLGRRQLLPECRSDGEGGGDEREDSVGKLALSADRAAARSDSWGIM